MQNVYGYDLETYPNVFTACFMDLQGNTYQYEISQWRDDSQSLRDMLLWLHENRCWTVGFNNLGFDYPILHLIIHTPGITVGQIYDKAQAIINSNEPFEHTVWENDHVIKQIDLYKIHHFDNVARRTGLKTIQFNMRMESVDDLPYPPGTMLRHDQVPVIHDYNKHDVISTLQFYRETIPMIEFREELSEKYGMKCINYNDTKIGKEYFIQRLEQARPGSCFYQGTRKPKQTKRAWIHLKECVFPWVTFSNDGFNRIMDYFKAQSITETKGVFKGLECEVNGFTFVFGLGGIHGSITFREVHADDEYEIIDLDVTSYYPSIPIVHRIYPEHLGEEFCDIYADVKAERTKYDKGTPENAMLKLALNGVYGDSNNKYSPFYDPQFTMTVTINGQLMLCMLSEWMMDIGAELIQVNTDGITIKSRRADRQKVDDVVKMWQMTTGLDLEEAQYSAMYIRDVNNYLAMYTDGGVKRKGAYEYERDWNQDHSALVIPKAVEHHLVDGGSIRQFIYTHTDIFDFMIRAKLPRHFRLELHTEDHVTPLQNTQRYYITTEGGYLKKIMPPLKGKTDNRVNDIESGWKVTPCNRIEDAQAVINYEYYIEQAEKLTLEMH